MLALLLLRDNDTDPAVVPTGLTPLLSSVKDNAGGVGDVGERVETGRGGERGGARSVGEPC